MTRLALLYSIATTIAFASSWAQALSSNHASMRNSPEISRRNVVKTTFACLLPTMGVMLTPTSSLAAADCFKDCLKNCKLIAPKDPEYCTANCKGYCEQDDRNDGLSGSVSSSQGEVGILGGAWGQGTVPKGEDKPPALGLPGLDFTSEKGRNLIGY